MQKITKKRTDRIATALLRQEEVVVGSNHTTCGKLNGYSVKEKGHGVTDFGRSTCGRKHAVRSTVW
jgi:hypothetical protein